MNRRHFLATPAALLALGPATSAAAPREGEKPASLWGVSLAGPEFGTHLPTFSNNNPGVFGRDYTYNSERTVAYFCDRGLSLLRLPLRWERLQPTPGGPLDAEELGRLRTFLGWAGKHGGKVILDLHNYGRYTLARGGRPTSCIIDQKMGEETPITRAHFADLWRRLSREFAAHPTVHAYGLMNEPHDLGASDWQAISQHAVDTIRAEKDRKLLLVAGDDWSSAERWVRANGPRPWIKDPVNQIAYEAHCYFDVDHSGKYQHSYDAERKADPHIQRRGVARLMPFVGWCLVNEVRGLVGEFGIPADEPGWREGLSAFLALLDRAGLDGCYWAAGEWWGDYRLSLQPTNDFRTPSPLLSLLTSPPGHGG
jgi:endoglucanase